MTVDFFKYQGTGNDFIVLDNRGKKYSGLTQKQIAFLCNRHFGIGADGLMLLQLKDGFDFEMVYFNSDGAEGSMCGNGGRCLVAFANQLGLITTTATFTASDGIHEAAVKEDGMIELKMKDVTQLERTADHSILNTGSPHYIKWVDNADEVNVFEEGKKIRNSKKFAQEGINVNFVEVQPAGLKVRTYERGVEAETLSCGTGVTAAALAAATMEAGNIFVITPGGELSVKYQYKEGLGFSNVWLCGPAQFVFAGTIDL
jgi:diaminopimelate epimerase